MGTSPRRLRRLIITLLTAAALVVPVASAPTAVANEPGTLDPTFGTDGYVIDPAGDAGRDLVIQPDGKIVVGGDSNLARYNPDGTLDTTFGTGGRVSPTALTIKRLALQNDGKVVAVGSSGADFAIFRFNSDGSPDAGFGTGSGLWTNDLSRQGFFDTAEDVVIQPDGKIVVVGLSYSSALFDASEILVVRFSTAGVPDPDFGGPLCGSCTGTGGSAYPGITSLNLTPLGIDAAFGVDLQGDGKIVIGGTIDHDNLLVARLTGGNSTPANTVGLLDTTYNTTGYRSIPTAGLVDEVWAVAVQPDDRTVFVGEDNTNVVVGRLTSSGALDTSFAGTGTIVTDIGAGTGGGEVGADVLIQPDGKIVVAGRALYLPSLDEWDFATFRYHPDGSPDTSFGGDGLVLTDLPGDWGELGWGVALQTDGKIVVSGGSPRGGPVSTLILRFAVAPVCVPGDGAAVRVGAGVAERGYPFGPVQLFDPAVVSSAPVTTCLTVAGAGGGVGGAGGGAGDPEVLCKWELPDMRDSVTTANTALPFVAGANDGPASSFYSDVADPKPVALELRNPWDDADVDGAGACDLVAGVPAQGDDLGRVMQVRANADDAGPGLAAQPPRDGTRTIELWALVSVNTDNVFWKILHPDGSVKYQIYGNDAQCADFYTELGLNGPGNSVITDSMFWAANGTGQVAEAALLGGQDAILEGCIQRDYEIWTGSFELSKHQPCGEYTVQAWATNFGADDMLKNRFDVICFHDLALDFDEINFGVIEPETPAFIDGDFTFDALNAGDPTVKNLGSGGMEVGVEFFKMVQQNVPAPKSIEIFDAKLGISLFDLEFPLDPAGMSDRAAPIAQDLRLETVNAVNAELVPQGGLVWFGTHDHQTVCANETAKLELSVHPGELATAGEYVGSMKVYARADAGTDFLNNAGARGVLKADGLTRFPRNTTDADNGPHITPGGTWNGPLLTYTCNNDNGIWGGYHAPGPVLDPGPGGTASQGGGYSNPPQYNNMVFDDVYFDGANYGRDDLSKEFGPSNQRSVWNQ